MSVGSVAQLEAIRWHLVAVLLSCKPWTPPARMQTVAWWLGILETILVLEGQRQLEEAQLFLDAVNGMGMRARRGR